MSGFYSRLTDKILAECASMTPRKVRIRIEIAIAMVITNDRDCITSEVWKSSAVNEPDKGERSRSSMGVF